MNARGLRVSSDADFSNLAVYEELSPRGPIARIVFANLEFDEGWRGNLTGFGALVGLIVFFAGMVGVPQLPFFSGELYMLFFAVGIAGVVGLIAMAKQPWLVRRAIELDFGADALRVLRNGKAEQQHALSRLANLTVEPHPEAEIERIDRMEKREKFPRQKERQHCLFGWFGAGGAEKKMLLARAEWPNNNSLFEVRQAILWTLQRAQPEQPKQAARSMNPPLD